ncbi:MAG: ATP-grasp domain-containing protein [Gammaproteobacteria bacterium]|nr:ATP-grasp domain-containing protein [Gammaproteobacteria bacterium]
MPDRFLLIAQPNSYRIAPYINAAKQMGLDVLIASRGEHSLITEVHEGLHVDLENPDEALSTILEEAARRPFAGVLGCDDSTVELAARVASTLALPHNKPTAAQASRRKDIARAHLLLAGCPIPGHCLLDLNLPMEKQLKGIPYPCVLKPLHLSASRGVIRANNEAELIAACERIKPIIHEYGDEFERSNILIESYIDGIEVAFEGFLQDGQLSTLTIFDKPDPLVGPYFEETIYVTPSQLDEATQQKILLRVQQACDAYELTTGPVHAELRINKDDAWILEIASRTIGGDCGRTLDTGNNLNLEALTIALAMGAVVEPPRMDGARGVMMIPIPKAGILKRVEGLMQARKIPYVEKVDIVIPDGHELRPLPEGNQYPGYIFARADKPETVLQALRDAHQQLKFIISPLWKIGAD